MMIRTFGTSKGERQLCDVVLFGLCLKDGGMEELFCCQYLPSVNTFLSTCDVCQPKSWVPVTVGPSWLLFRGRLFEDRHSDWMWSHYWKLVTGQWGRWLCSAQHQTWLGAVRPSSWTAMCSFSCKSDHYSYIFSTRIHYRQQSADTLSVDAYTTDNSLHELDITLKMFWDLESLGVKHDETSVYQGFQKDIRFRDGSRYEVSLPWKQSHPMLPSHYDLALKRLGRLLKRLRHTPDILCQYDAVIKVSWTEE